MDILNLFCLASGAKLNWTKIVSIWASPTERSWQWQDDPGITWLPAGHTTRLLGFPMGFRIPKEEINNKILLAINRSIISWGANTLSLAGRIMISNQVTLACIWYLCSCSSVTSAAFRQTRAVVRNYIWGASAGQKTRAKISWDVVVQPTAHGGVKIIDPALQSAALLTKIIVRGLKPGYAPWKTFIRREVALTKMTDQKRCPPSP